jgi:hypothetical protein
MLACQPRQLAALHQIYSEWTYKKYTHEAVSLDMSSANNERAVRRHRSHLAICPDPTLDHNFCIDTAFMSDQHPTAYPTKVTTPPITWSCWNP